MLVMHLSPCTCTDLCTISSGKQVSCFKDNPQVPAGVRRKPASHSQPHALWEFHLHIKDWSLPESQYTTLPPNIANSIGVCVTNQIHT